MEKKIIFDVNSPFGKKWNKLRNKFLKKCVFCPKHALLTDTFYNFIIIFIINIKMIYIHALKKFWSKPHVILK